MADSIDMQTHREATEAEAKALDQAKRFTDQRDNLVKAIAQQEEALESCEVLCAHYQSRAPAGAVANGGKWYLPK